MYTYQILIEYDGSNFVGWQTQKNGISVQEILEKALGKLLKKRVNIYGSGNQIRGYINIQDSVECIKIALKNKPKSGHLEIYNQFTEQFSVSQLALLVKKSMKTIGYNVKLKKMKNPRIESEDHYYNAKHSNLRKLGLKPTKLTEDIIIDKPIKKSGTRRRSGPYCSFLGHAQSGRQEIVRSRHISTRAQ